jgi:hypothetical protein
MGHEGATLIVEHRLRRLRGCNPIDGMDDHHGIA